MIQFFQEAHHFITIRRIQISRRFISEDNTWIGNNGTRYGHTLLLSTGKLLRIMLGAVSYLHTLQSLIDTFHTLTRGYSGIEQRKFHVFKDCKFIYQIETLNTKPKISVTQIRTVILGIVGNFLIQKPKFTGSGLSSKPIIFSKVDLPQPERSHNGK